MAPAGQQVEAAGQQVEAAPFQNLIASNGRRFADPTPPMSAEEFAISSGLMRDPRASMFDNPETTPMPFANRSEEINFRRAVEEVNPNTGLQPIMEKVKAEDMVEDLYVREKGLGEVSQKDLDMFKAQYKDVPFNALQDSTIKPSRRRDRMEMLDLSDEDIAAIGADLGLSGDNITTFKLQKKNEEVMDQNRLLIDIEQEFTRLKMNKSSFAVDTLEQQRKLLNDLVNEYEELYKQLGEE